MQEIKTLCILGQEFATKTAFRYMGCLFAFFHIDVLE